MRCTMSFRTFLAAVSLAPLSFVSISNIGPWKSRRFRYIIVLFILTILATLSGTYLLHSASGKRRALRMESMDAMIKQRAQHIAFIRCALDPKWAENNMAAWPICGVVGDPLSTLIRSNTPEDRNVVYVEMDANSVEAFQDELRRVLLEWQKDNALIRTATLQELPRDSNIYKQLNTVLNEHAKRIGRH